LVWEALQAAYELEKQNINARVINMHTIKPIDTEIIIKAAKETGAIVTAEEHQIYGGLGSAVAEVLVKNYPVPVSMIGINDKFGESGKPDELMQKYGMTAEHIIFEVKNMLERTNFLK
jgi:transketolase